MALTGDEPIHFEEYQFTLADVAFLSEVPQKTVRNWLARDVLKVGKKHFLGRWAFNVLDAIRLAVMRDLTTFATVPLADAARLAELAASEALKSTIRNPTGQLLSAADGFRPNVMVLAGVDEQGQTKAWVANIKNPGHYYAPHYLDGDRKALRRTHIVIPVTAIMGDTILRIEQLAQNTHADDEGSDA